MSNSDNLKPTSLTGPNGERLGMDYGGENTGHPHSTLEQFANCPECVPKREIPEAVPANILRGKRNVSLLREEETIPMHELPPQLHSPAVPASGERPAPMEFEVSKTNRGFDIVRFRDYNDVDCTIQESSLATDHAIWLGCEHEEPKVLIPGEGWKPFDVPETFQCNTRMHLTREQVGYLLPFLQRFYETGRIA